MGKMDKAWIEQEQPMKKPYAKVVINTCYGGFSLTPEAMERLKELGEDRSMYDLERHNPKLVQVVEELGTEAAGGSYTKLKLVEIYCSKYRIKEYDGAESVETPDTIIWTDVGEVSDD